MRPRSLTAQPERSAAKSKASPLPLRLRRFAATLRASGTPLKRHIRSKIALKTLRSPFDKPVLSRSKEGPTDAERLARGIFALGRSLRGSPETDVDKKVW